MKLDLNANAIANANVISFAFTFACMQIDPSERRRLAESGQIEPADRMKVDETSHGDTVGWQASWPR